MPKNIVKDLRIKFHINRKYLAEVLGITETGYYLKESGKNQFTINEYRKLFNIYSSLDKALTAEEFFTEETKAKEK